jgi:DNA-binding transcriptional ArsR family regulator
VLSDQEREERDRILAQEVGRDPRLGNTARVIFMTLAAVDTGLSPEALAKRTSKSPDAIDRGLAELRDAGYVTADADGYRVDHSPPTAPGRG